MHSVRQVCLFLLAFLFSAPLAQRISAATAPADPCTLLSPADVSRAWEIPTALLRKALLRVRSEIRWREPIANTPLRMAGMNCFSGSISIIQQPRRPICTPG